MASDPDHHDDLFLAQLARRPGGEPGDCRAQGRSSLRVGRERRSNTIFGVALGHDSLARIPGFAIRGFIR